MLEGYLADSGLGEQEPWIMSQPASRQTPSSASVSTPSATTGTPIKCDISTIFSRKAAFRRLLARARDEVAVDLHDIGLGHMEELEPGETRAEIVDREAKAHFAAERESLLEGNVALELVALGELQDDSRGGEAEALGDPGLTARRPARRTEDTIVDVVEQLGPGRGPGVEIGQVPWRAGADPAREGYFR